MPSLHPHPRRGATLVEYAIVMPLAVVLILAVIDAGRLMLSYTALARAVDIAARCASVDSATCGSAAATEAYAATQAPSLDTTLVTFTASSPACGRQVSGTLAFRFVTPWQAVAAPFGVTDSLALTSIACYPA